MPRLDVWLVTNRYFQSRQIAKRAIREGHVTVNGSKAKPSTNVTGKEYIIVSDLSNTQPIGYSKIKELEIRIGKRLVNSGDHVLDIGCSTGGFLKFLLENGAKVVGVEVSTEFMDNLQGLVEDYSELSLIIDNAFSIDLDIIANESTLDLLLIDVTTEPSGTLTLVERFTPLLKTGGRLITAFKSKSSIEKIKQFEQQITLFGYKNVETIVLEEKLQELHITAIYY